MLETTPLIIGMMGQKQAGKDTFANFLIKNHNFERIALADAVRDALYILDPYVPVTEIGNDWRRVSTVVKQIGWERAKQIPEIRRLLQVTGTEVGREMFGPDVWVVLALQKIGDAIDRGSNVVITDVRFRNEIQAIRKLRGYLIRIDRPGLPDIDGHISEHDWRTENPDYAYMNDGSLALMEGRVKQLVNALHAQKGLLE